MKNSEITWDADTLSWVKTETVTLLDTGIIKHYYHCNGTFILRERVLHGFKKQFLDGLDIFTTQGYHIGKIYRIRNNEFWHKSSEELVRKMLSEFLWSDKNRESLDSDVDALYHMSALYCMHIKLFINNHEK